MRPDTIPTLMAPIHRQYHDRHSQTIFSNDLSWMDDETLRVRAPGPSRFARAFMCAAILVILCSSLAAWAMRG